MTSQSGSLTNDGISKMIVDVEKLKIEDRLWKEKEEMRNELDQYIYDTIKNRQIKIQVGRWRRKISKTPKQFLTWQVNGTQKMENVRSLCRNIDKKELATLMKF